MASTAALPEQASAQAGAGIIATDIPARLDRLRWGRFHTLVVVALGITWILDGLEVTLAGAVAPALKQSPRAAFLQRRGRLGEQCLSRRRGAGRPVLRLAHRSARAQTAVLHHARALSGRHRGHRAVMEFVELCAVSVLDRRRHRRGIHRHQFGDPGADPRALPRLDRPRHQRQLLARRCRGCGSLDHPARSRRAGARYGMALRLSHRRDARPRHPPDAHVAAGIAALADDARPRRRSQQRASTASRPNSARAGIASTTNRSLVIRLRTRRFTPAGGGGQHAVSCRAPAHARGFDADGGAGVLLQRHLLHLRAGADRFLRHPGRPRRLVSAALRRRKLSRAGASRPAVRHRRAPHHDRRDLCGVRPAACRRRVICSPSGSCRQPARPSPGWSSSSLPRRRRARPISR